MFDKIDTRNDIELKTVYGFLKSGMQKNIQRLV